MFGCQFDPAVQLSAHFDTWVPLIRGGAIPSLELLESWPLPNKLVVVLSYHIEYVGGVSLDVRADVCSFPCTRCTSEKTQKAQSTTLCT